jgi:membrane-associated phospholipid phosphatase
MHFWHLLTRLGEAQILLPAVLLAALSQSWRRKVRPLVGWWMVLLALAVAVTIATKVAFIGWGVGWRAIDFTGISGHTMLAAAIYPLLLAMLVGGLSPPWPTLAVLAGCVLAMLIGVSRVMVHAHSISEVLAGLLVGGAASAAAFVIVGPPRHRVGALLPTALALWLALMPQHAPASTTQSLVTQLALRLSGHTRPCTRRDLMRFDVHGDCNGARQHQRPLRIADGRTPALS